MNHKAAVATPMVCPAVAAATEREYEEQNWLRDTADFKEGTRAMGERRTPNFQAR